MIIIKVQYSKLTIWLRHKNKLNKDLQSGNYNKIYIIYSDFLLI